MKARPEKCTLSDEELATVARKWISMLCKSNGEAWTLRVPVDFNYDPDMVLSECIDRMKQAQAQRDELLEALKNMVLIAHSDKWGDATTGRQIVLEDAVGLIQKLNTKSAIEHCK